MQEIEYKNLGDIPQKVKLELIDIYNLNPTELQIKNICNYIIYYYNNPDKMQLLPDENRDFYEKFTSMLALQLENNIGNSSGENGNEKSYKYGSNGFSNIILISIVMIILVLVVVFLL